jgi:hypothetical protein
MEHLSPDIVQEATKKLLSLISPTVADVLSQLIAEAQSEASGRESSRGELTGDDLLDYLRYQDDGCPN